jgi:hypothetical protein
MEDEIDLRLKRLAVAAQQQPAGSHQRDRALTKLMDEIYRSRKLGHPQRGSWPAGVYEDLHSEAVLKTFEYIRQNIDTYDATRPLMGWVNYILNLRFSDATQRYMNQQCKILSIDDLDIQQASQSDEMSIMLRELIEEDPDGLFRSVSLRKHPDITWQDIAKAKILDDETFDSISKKYDVSIPTISSLFNRNLRNFSDYIRNKLQ